ncbi:MAG: hypothetical protein JW981_10655 [Anaerolineae bacterium]|nr:hypothetical protein [Anaerolineae bacterium]
MSDYIGVFISAAITLIIFSYLFGDHFLYRWALALLVGSGTGYALGIILRTVLFEWITVALSSTASIGVRIQYIIPLLLGAFLLLKGIPNISHVGNISMGVLLGVGAAVAISGALLGTLIPQVAATGKAVSAYGFLGGILTVIGTICALAVFSPSALDEDKWYSKALSQVQVVGRLFVIIALAMAFAGAITTALTIWVDQWLNIATLPARISSFIGG